MLELLETMRATEVKSGIGLVVRNKDDDSGKTVVIGRSEREGLAIKVVARRVHYDIRTDILPHEVYIHTRGGINRELHRARRY